MVLALGAVMILAGQLAFASGASAATATSASLTMTSEPGDYIGAGLTYSYSTESGDVFSSTSDGNAVHVALTGANGDWWYLDFAAPAGQQLTPGVYLNATRYPFQAPSEPGLAVSGNGRGCNMLTGSFEVLEATYGANNSLLAFRATFEQHCEGQPPALRGSISLVNPEPPPPLEIQLTVDETGTVNRHTGAATVGGTITCSRIAQVYLFGTLSQRANRSAVSVGSFGFSATCSPTPTAWETTVSPAGGAPFNPGKAQLDVTATAFDPEFGTNVTDSASQIVRLKRGT